MLNIAHLRQQRLADESYRWGLIDQLFTPRDGWQLAETYPRDSPSTMWPTGESPELHDYPAEHSSAATSWWRRIFT